MKLPIRQHYSNEIDSIVNRIYNNHKPSNLDDLIEKILLKEFPHFYEMMHFEKKLWKHEQRMEYIGIQNIYTPFEKIFTKDTFDLIKFFSDHSYFESYLFMYNWEIFIYLFKNSLLNYFKNKQLFYAADSKEDEIICKLISKICNINIKIIKLYNFKDNKKYENNVNEAIKKCMEECGVKHFDLVLSNPPYGTRNANALDLRILKTCFNISKKIIFIHPSEFLFSDSTKNIKKYLKSSPFLKDLYLFYGDKIFNINNHGIPLCISCWDTEKTNFNVNVKDMFYSKTTFSSNIFEFSPIKCISQTFPKEIKNEIIQLKDKVCVSNKNNLFNKRIKFDFSDITNFVVVPPRMIWENTYDEQKQVVKYNLQLIANKPNKSIKRNKTYRPNRMRQDEYLAWAFNSEKEQDNFINYLKSKIVRFIFIFVKTNQGVSNIYNILPYFDFTQEWNDAKLCKEFGISEELWNYIDNFIPNYYDDYKSGFEK